ncbi:MAG TPA: DDE-type integrase/transposase/recombinase [Acidisarcina sp.]
MYLATGLDLFDRRIVGWSTSGEMTAALATDALEMAWHSQPCGSSAYLILHSDRGSQYASGRSV